MTSTIINSSKVAYSIEYGGAVVLQDRRQLFWLFQRSSYTHTKWLLYAKEKANMT